MNWQKERSCWLRQDSQWLPVSHIGNHDTYKTMVPEAMRSGTYPAEPPDPLRINEHLESAANGSKLAAPMIAATSGLRIA
ncbi:MAG TPA: hypothetical protein VFV38_51240 [Ktedonobacteraceae bacterium]|nr:hypothetical protein [Ktedonobacteraceae bacterium]